MLGYCDWAVDFSLWVDCSRHYFWHEFLSSKFFAPTFHFKHLQFASHIYSGPFHIAALYQPKGRQKNCPLQTYINGLAFQN